MANQNFILASQTQSLIFNSVMGLDYQHLNESAIFDSNLISWDKLEAWLLHTSKCVLLLMKLTRMK